MEVAQTVRIIRERFSLVKAKIYKLVVKKAVNRIVLSNKAGEESAVRWDKKKIELDRDDDEERYRRGIYTRTSQEVVSACTAICNAS